ncbi:MAG: ABC transporter ATP-binding protein [Lachnospiraceae bacterium]
MIEAIHISKKFGRSEILSDISFQVSKGEIYGLVGCNGVGKTTLLKILGGIYRPDQGYGQIAGEKVYENDKVKRHCFFMTEEATFFEQSSLNQMRKFYQGYYPKWEDRTFNGLVDWFRVDPSMKISRFSKGMQRQAGLILAFSTHAEYLFLDEAFDGLDFTMRRQISGMLRYYAASAPAALLISSHNLKELEDLADHIGMINEGKLIFNGSVQEMRENYQTCSFTFGNSQMSSEAEKVMELSVLNRILDAELTEKTSDGYLCILHTSKQEAFRRLEAVGADDIRIRPVQLEEFFRIERKEQEVDWEKIFG